MYRRLHLGDFAPFAIGFLPRKERLFQMRFNCLRQALVDSTHRSQFFSRGLLNLLDRAELGQQQFALGWSNPRDAVQA